MQCIGAPQSPAKLIIACSLKVDSTACMQYDAISRLPKSDLIRLSQTLNLSRFGVETHPGCSKRGLRAWIHLLTVV